MEIKRDLMETLLKWKTTLLGRLDRKTIADSVTVHSRFEEQ